MVRRARDEVTVCNCLGLAFLLHFCVSECSHAFEVIAFTLLLFAQGGFAGFSSPAGHRDKTGPMLRRSYLQSFFNSFRKGGPQHPEGGGEPAEQQTFACSAPGRGHMDNKELARPANADGERASVRGKDQQEITTLTVIFFLAGRAALCMVRSALPFLTESLRRLRW